MIVLPTLPMFFDGTYLTYIFLLILVFGLIFRIFRGQHMNLQNILLFAILAVLVVGLLVKE